MKLSILAIAIVAATASASVHSAAHSKDGLAIGGMVRADYDNDSEKLTTKVELNLDATGTAKGITYFGHAQLEGAGNTAGTSTDTQKHVTTDDLYFGMKGGFGEVRIGDTDNGCDATDVGGFPDEFYGSVAVAGCAGNDQNNITYKNSAGPVSYALSYSPEANEDNFSLGGKAKLGMATISLGHTAGDGVSDTTVLGLAGALGPISLGLRASDVEGASDNLVQVHGSYSSGANTFVVGVADVGDTTPIQAYWTRDLGGKALFRVEVQDADDGTDTDMMVRLQKNF